MGCGLRRAPAVLPRDGTGHHKRQRLWVGWSEVPRGKDSCGLHVLGWGPLRELAAVRGIKFEVPRPGALSPESLPRASRRLLTEAPPGPAARDAVLTWALRRDDGYGWHSLAAWPPGAQGVRASKALEPACARPAQGRVQQSSCLPNACRQPCDAEGGSRTLSASSPVAPGDRGYGQPPDLSTTEPFSGSGSGRDATSRRWLAYLSVRATSAGPRQDDPPDIAGAEPAETGMGRSLRCHPEFDRCFNTPSHNKPKAAQLLR
jgi:hypothetical protein